MRILICGYRVDATRRAILQVVRSMLGPMYDSSKEEEYIRVFSEKLRAHNEGDIEES